jgi:hypothetical protein
MGIDLHLSTCVDTQSPKYLEMAQEHISLSKCYFENFEIFRWWCAVLLLWANTLSPFGMNRQKQRLLRALFTFSSIGK